MTLVISGCGSENKCRKGGGYGISDTRSSMVCKPD
jgi:hypothetical protein